VTAWTEIGVKDVTDFKNKSSGTKLAFSKVQGLTRAFAKSLRKNLPISPFNFKHRQRKTDCCAVICMLVRLTQPTISIYLGSLYMIS
jgi:hypothetical protein